MSRTERFRASRQTSACDERLLIRSSPCQNMLNPTPGRAVPCPSRQVRVITGAASKAELAFARRAGDLVIALFRADCRYSPGASRREKSKVSLRFHLDRAAGRDRDHRGLDLAVVTRGTVSPRGRQARSVREQPQADRTGLAQLSLAARLLPARLPFSARPDQLRQRWSGLGLGSEVPGPDGADRSV